MKKLVIAISLTLFAVSLLLIGCGGKYSDAIAVNEEYITIIEDYLTDIDKVDDAKSAAKAINTFADELDKIWPKMQKLAEKYPELEDETAIPEELKEIEKKAEEVGMKMGASMMKVMSYMKDPDVQAAQKRLSEIMMQRN